jgi:hypothetical protein
VKQADDAGPLTSGLVDRLCASVDPVVAYRARRLLRETPADSPTLVALREAIGDSPMAARLLRALTERPLHPYAKWQGPHWTLYSLAEIAYPARRAELLPLRDRVLDWLLAPAFLKPRQTTVYEDQPERPRRCASMEGNAVWSQVTLGIVDADRTPRLVERLVAMQWPDGGWNCDRRQTARTSSVQETLIPLRGLWRWWQVTGDDRARQAAMRAAEFLLARRLLWRRRDGALIRPEWGGPVDRIHYPVRFYDVLSALLAMTEIGLIADPRCADALALLESKRRPDGTYPVEWTNTRTTDTITSRGTFADWGPRGRSRANPFVTIDALHVLRRAGPNVLQAHASPD